MTRSKPAELKPLRTGFCNLSWSLDREDGRASHRRCQSPVCPCVCHQPEPSYPDLGHGGPTDPTDLSVPSFQRVSNIDFTEEPEPDPLAGLTVPQAVDLFLAAAEHLDTAASYEAVRVLDHTTLIRLLDRLRAATLIAGDIDRTLVGAAYAKGRGDHVIDGIGPVKVSRSVTRKSWDERGIAQGVIDTRMQRDHPDGSLPNPWEVIDWFLEVVHVDYARVGSLKALGLDPEAYCDEELGRPSVTLPRRS